MIDHQWNEFIQVLRSAGIGQEGDAASPLFLSMQSIPTMSREIVGQLSGIIKGHMDLCEDKCPFKVKDFCVLFMGYIPKGLYFRSMRREACINVFGYRRKGKHSEIAGGDDEK